MDAQFDVIVPVLAVASIVDERVCADQCILHARDEAIEAEEKDELIEERREKRWREK